MSATVRRATEADEGVLSQLWTEFEREIPAPPELQETWAEEWQDTRRNIAGDASRNGRKAFF